MAENGTQAPHYLPWLGPALADLYENDAHEARTRGLDQDVRSDLQDYLAMTPTERELYQKERMAKLELERIRCQRLKLRATRAN